jgi:hypothetical protein
MKKVILLLIVASASLFVLNSCYYDIESQLYPVGSTNCDTTNVTYSVTVTGILSANACLSCHGGTGASGGNIILDNYNSVKNYAQNGKLYGSISHSPGYSPMPQGGNKLSSCNILKIKKWIDRGMLNN